MDPRLRCTGRLAWWPVKSGIKLISAEFLLDWRKQNGGAVIVVRALWTSLWSFAILLCAYTYAKHYASGRPTTLLPTWSQLVALSIEHNRLFLGLFAGTYAAYYARFSSQWNYLANLYNQIKAVEVTCVEPEEQSLADWKAGFIADAWTLHLIAKPIFRNAAAHWYQEPLVKKQVDGWPRTSQLVNRMATTNQPAVDEQTRPPGE